MGYKYGLLTETVQDLLGERAIDPFMKWLEDIGYFICPAAKSHHGNVKGGLYLHSNAVANELYEMTNKMGLLWRKPESPWVVGLLHDVCKCDDYDYKFDEENEADNYISMNPSMRHSGHGAKSVLMLAGRFPLTEEEVMCITYHMGAFTEKDDWKYYSKACHDYPNVLWTHTADMLASQVRGI